MPYASPLPCSITSISPLTRQVSEGLVTGQGPGHSLTSNPDLLALKAMHLDTVRPSHKLPWFLRNRLPATGLLGTQQGGQTGAQGPLLSHLARPFLSLYTGLSSRSILALPLAPYGPGTYDLPNPRADLCGLLHAGKEETAGWLAMSMKNAQFVSAQSRPSTRCMTSCFSIYFFLMELGVV